MVKNHFSRILGERKLTILAVHQATGISRVTLGRLYHETGDAIRYDTINSLCQYFGCRLEDLLEYIPD